MSNACLPAATATDACQGRRILLVTPDRFSEVARQLAEISRNRGYAVEWAPMEPDEVGTVVEHAVVFIDWSGQDARPQHLVDALHRRRSRGPYVIAVIARVGAVTAADALTAGADDYIETPLDPEVALARLTIWERLVGLQNEIDAKNRRLSKSNRRLTNLNLRLHEQLESASRVQQSLLPSTHLHVPGIDLGWRLRPCEELAGDILNCVRLDEHHLACYVLDVSGHGVTAALLAVQVARLMSPMMSESNLLKKPLPEPPWYEIVDPAEVVGQLNKTFQMAPELPQYFTMVYTVLDLQTGCARIASGGHPPPIHVPAGGHPEELSSAKGGMPVGFLENARYESTELQLACGDRLWFYSDGIIEAVSPRGDMLQTAGLNRAIERHNGLPVQEAVDRAMGDIEQWTHPGVPVDDCSLLTLELSALLRP